jgi:hypothetical protein
MESGSDVGCGGEPGPLCQSRSCRLVCRADARKDRTGKDYPGTSSSVVTARCGSAKPLTHFSDALVSYFSA